MRFACLTALLLLPSYSTGNTYSSFAMALDGLSWARIAFTSVIAALAYGVMRLI